MMCHAKIFVEYNSYICWGACITSPTSKEYMLGWNLNLEPKTRISDLSLFDLSLLAPIHCFIAVTQVKSCFSSAYVWYDIPCSRRMSPKVLLHQRKDSFENRFLRYPRLQPPGRRSYRPHIVDTDKLTAIIHVGAALRELHGNSSDAKPAAWQ